MQERHADRRRGQEPRTPEPLPQPTDTTGSADPGDSHGRGLELWCIGEAA